MNRIIHLKGGENPFIEAKIGRPVYTPEEGDTLSVLVPEDTKIAVPLFTWKMTLREAYGLKERGINSTILSIVTPIRAMRKACRDSFGHGGCEVYLVIYTPFHLSETSDLEAVLGIIGVPCDSDDGERLALEVEPMLEVPPIHEGKADDEGDRAYIVQFLENILRAEDVTVH